MSVGLAASVIVSPTLASLTFFIDAVTYPTSPALSSFIGSTPGVNTPTSVTSYTLLLAINLILSPIFIFPSLILTIHTTPL